MVALIASERVDKVICLRATSLGVQTNLVTRGSIQNHFSAMQLTSPTGRLLARTRSLGSVPGGRLIG